MEARVRTSGLAIASLILGILSLVFCWAPYFIGVIMGVLAIVFGGVAMGQTGRDPALGGRGMAIAGLICGIIGVVIFVILVIVVISLFI
jgi:hypothetical protein